MVFLTSFLTLFEIVVLGYWAAIIQHASKVAQIKSVLYLFKVKKAHQIDISDRKIVFDLKFDK